MSFRVNYDVVKRPSNTVKGRTNILGTTTDGGKKTEIAMGYITKLRSAKSFEAYLQTGQDQFELLPDTEALQTRSQAAHAINRAYRARFPEAFA